MIGQRREGERFSSSRSSASSNERALGGCDETLAERAISIISWSALGQHQTEGVEVGGGADAAAPDLLGGHVARGAHHLAVGGERLASLVDADRLGHAKVHDPDEVVLPFEVRQEDVGGLDIAVDDAAAVGLHQTLEREVLVEARLLSATNRSLTEEVAAGRFREDLYYRLAGIELVLPPLRERLDDLEHLARLFLAQETERRKGLPGVGLGAWWLGPAALARLRGHLWPGNVRELQNVISRAVVLAESEEIVPEDILLTGWEPGEEEGGAGAELPPEPGAPPLRLPQLDVTFREFKTAVIQQSEVHYLRRLLDRAEGNVSAAARLADLSRSHLRVLLERYGLHQPRRRGEPPEA